ncbi:hypothetical protein NCG89_02930 [Spongiibacter taiwanensis]|uniref:hypothetical protein n=1 Tax=Spongiibacter taiwanensis TaxID=1748242 RepID=UPI002034C91D|nr:hypothetical protein [Spongiibacter taiwanensis]USA43750.1 hypothetical protein NCG89_02930 [Spongiibacter taiwanensis]
MDPAPHITLSVPRASETNIWDALSDWNKAASILNLILVHRKNMPRDVEDKILLDLHVESTHPAQFGMFNEDDFETLKAILFSEKSEFNSKFRDTKQSTKNKILSCRKNISKNSAELILKNNERKSVPKDERAIPTFTGKKSSIRITGNVSELNLHDGTIKTIHSKINHKDFSSITSTFLKLSGKTREKIEEIVANNRITNIVSINTYQADEEQLTHTYEIIRTDLHKVLSLIAQVLAELEIEDADRIPDSGHDLYDDN